MCKTFITVLEHLGIEIGQVITLYDLDEIIAEKFPEMRTQLEDGLEADSVLDDREYKYWISDDDELGYDIYFEVVEDYQPDPVFTRIKII